MRYAHFDFDGKPARIGLDELGAPESCEIFDPATGDLKRADELLQDVYDSHSAHAITEDEFNTMMRGARAHQADLYDPLGGLTEDQRARAAENAEAATLAEDRRYTAAINKFNAKQKSPGPK